jgi:hypothetical protein
MRLTVEIFGILAMCTFMFISIWGFILLSKLFNQIRYSNYLLEKLTNHTYLISNKDKESNKDYTE